jgi:hypothetical protein
MQEQPDAALHKALAALAAQFQGNPAAETRLRVITEALTARWAPVAWHVVLRLMRHIIVQTLLDKQDAGTWAHTTGRKATGSFKRLSQPKTLSWHGCAARWSACGVRSTRCVVVYVCGGAGGGGSEHGDVVSASGQACGPGIDACRCCHSTSAHYTTVTRPLQATNVNSDTNTELQQAQQQLQASQHAQRWVRVGAHDGRVRGVCRTNHQDSPAATAFPTFA